MKKNGTKTIAALALAALVALMAAGCGDDFYNLSSRRDEGPAQLEGRVYNFLNNPNVGPVYDFGSLEIGGKSDDYSDFRWERWGTTGHITIWVTVEAPDVSGLTATENGPVSGYEVKIPVKNTFGGGTVLGNITITAIYNQTAADEDGEGSVTYMVAYL